MKNSFILRAFFCLLVAFSITFFACEKAENPASSASKTWQGQFKKALTIADPTGENTVDLEISADDLATLDRFEPATFELEVVREIPGGEAEKAETDQPEPLVSDEKETASNRYFVRVVSKKAEPGAVALLLKMRPSAAAEAVEDRACFQSFGYFTNGTNGIGCSNQGTCPKIVTARFFTFNQGVATQWAFGLTSFWNLRSGLAPCNGGQANSYILQENQSGTLRRWRTVNDASRFVTATFFNYQGKNVGLKVQNAACSGSFLGIFLFV